MLFEGVFEELNIKPQLGSPLEGSPRPSEALQLLSFWIDSKSWTPEDITDTEEKMNT